MNEICKLMSPQERRIYNNLPQSKGDLIIKGRMLKETMKQILDLPFERELEDGSKVVASVGETLVIKKVLYDIEHPENINLKDYSTVLGENKVEINANLRNARELFGDIVIDVEEQ